jgi:putative membrane protein
MKINFLNYFYYKFFNSVFGGLTVGAIFSIYAPLNPSIFSAGGIVLAIGLLVVAKFYDKLIEIKKFFQISMFVEIIMLVAVIVFLFKPFDYMVALFIYLGYQITFMFGSYLVRAETLFIKKKFLLSKLDIYKQSGYLVGLLVSWIFYEIFDFNNNEEKVFYLHYLLFIVEIMILVLLKKSFTFAAKPNFS